jgi:hypothetical protein
MKLRKPILVFCMFLLAAGFTVAFSAMIRAAVLVAYSPMVAAGPKVGYTLDPCFPFPYPLPTPPHCPTLYPTFNPYPPPPTEPTPSDTPVTTEEPTGGDLVFLPFLTKPCTGICGRVTENGFPVSNITLDLRFFDGVNWSTIDTIQTGSNGIFSFCDAPSLYPGEVYYVLYLNDSSVSDRMWGWGTRDLTNYTSGSTVEIGEFDLEDIILVSPASGAHISLPHTFQWIRRSASPSDNYEFHLYDFSDDEPHFSSYPRLGYASAYALPYLPVGFANDTQYAWDIWVYSPDGGSGVSYDTRGVIFGSGGEKVEMTGEQIEKKLIWEENSK